MKDLDHKSTKTYRFKDNPLEEALAKKWEELNTQEASPAPVLAYLMGDGNEPDMLTQRDADVAKRTIQWMGSPVGMSMLLSALINTPDARKYLERELEVFKSLEGK